MKNNETLSELTSWFSNTQGAPHFRDTRYDARAEHTTQDLADAAGLCVR